ncbi:ATP-binding cassette domain-containing protein [Candidatus Spongiihabitans sp.]|uniref:thiamine ABC transporter ATP-binding protein n=1 Tax=Candidatus Spongiihabitans sp. TaxID=3101308 RepID=UPI003C7AAAE8
MLEVENVHFDYAGERSGDYPGGATIRADFTVATGHSAALMGPSGSGKSTILNLIAGFLQPHRGDLRFARQSLLGLAPAKRPLTYLLQAHNLFPHLTVRQNLAIGLHPGMRLSPQQNVAIDQALESVSLCEFAHRKPDSLSGGQQQRVALARCLARNRPLLLLDEPFSGLDETLRAEMLSLILRLQEKRALTLLITTHQQRDADVLGAEVVMV